MIFLSMFSLFLTKILYHNQFVCIEIDRVALKLRDMYGYYHGDHNFMAFDFLAPSVDLIKI